MRIGRLVADLESLAVADAAGFSLKREPTDLRSLVEEVVTEFAGPFAAEGIRLESAVTPVQVDADPGRVRQVLANLLSNSLKFTPEGGRVRVEVVPEGDVALIRVTDSGSGIAEEDLPRVFDRFFRGHGAQSGGSGIGLTVVQDLVHAHRGGVEILSTEGRGTSVTIRLPALPGPFKPTPATVESGNHLSAEFTLSSQPLPSVSTNRRTRT